jgi:aspartyl/asparaginyl beta-hydroxylase (cupin superfamily)
MNAIRSGRIPLAFRLLHRFERYIARHSVHGDPPFYDPAAFAWAPALQAACDDIRAEYRQLVAAGETIPPFHEISREQLPISSDSLWRSFILYAYGVRAQRNCALCPRTEQAVLAVPGMQTAMFSILAPGKRLPPHRGPYKGLLRVHLALDLPPDPASCWIEVDGIRRHWRQGGLMVFDDTFVHSAANESAVPRCVLFMDILRPLDRRTDRINRGLLALLRASPFARRAKAVFRDWYRRHGIEADA